MAGEAVSLKNLCELILNQGLITPEALARGEEIAGQGRIRLPAALTRLGLLSEAELSDAFSELLQIRRIHKNGLSTSISLPPDVNITYLRTRRVLPLVVTETEVELVMADPLDQAAVSAMQFLFQKQLVLAVAEESDVDEALENILLERASSESPVVGVTHNGTQVVSDLVSLSDRDSDAPVIRLVSRLIAKAVTLHASDIHIEPQVDALIVRFRIDGDLGEQESHYKRFADPVVSRIKLMAKLDIAEKRLPQDGRIQTSVRGNPIELRIATFPTLHGESLVVRILGQLDIELELGRVGLSETGLCKLRASLTQPNGLILITGPTGSGKTTTLYAALNAIRNPDLKLVTVEDPIEYSLPGISQLQVKPEIGLTFANALRSVLRNDPDVIMVGEIRDKETADIAIRAALTGHLVLATLHTNTAAGAITRLLDLGIEDYLLASVLLLASAQRLVRRVCSSCGEWVQLDKQDTDYIRLHCGKRFQLPNGMSRQPKGCPICNGRGFKGRSPLFEAITITDSLRSRIVGDFDEAAFEDLAREGGAETLFEDGVLQVAAGLTTLEEVVSVVGK